MPVKVDATQYLENISEPQWHEYGSIFIRILPQFTINDSTDHCFGSKVLSPFSFDFFAWSKNAANQLQVGFHVSGEYRLSTGAASALIATDTWANHLFTWDMTASQQAYYVNNVSVATSATPFAVTTSTRICFGNIQTPTPSQAANSYICEHGRWTRVLTAAERHTLQITGCPLFIPNGLVVYHPMRGSSDAGRDLIGFTPLSTIGGPLLEAQSAPYSIRPYSGFVAPAPAHPVTLSAPAISNPFQLFAPAVTVAAAVPTIAPPVIAAPFSLFAPSVTTDLGLAPPLLSNAFAVYAPAVHLQETTIEEDSRELEPHNLRVRILDYVAGDDLRISRIYTGLAGGILITKAYLTIKRQARDADADAVLQKTIIASEGMSGEITDADTTGGSIALHFDLSKNDTALLTPLTPFDYDVQVITIGNAVYTCEKGVIVMHQGVTDASS